MTKALQKNFTLRKILIQLWFLHKIPWLFFEISKFPDFFENREIPWLFHGIPWHFPDSGNSLTFSWPWTPCLSYLSPTTHGLLNHSAGLIQQNDWRGLINFSESALETNNKFLRFYRSSIRRKSSFENNLSDCIQRLWMKSDPVIIAAVPPTSLKRRNISSEAALDDVESQYRQLFIIQQQ